MALRLMDTLKVEGRRVLLRLDLNVPLKDGKVGDETRIREAAPTVRALAERGAVVIACSHLGRAKGKPDPALSLAPVAPILARLAGRPVRFVPDTVGEVAKQAVAAAKPGDVLLLENLRFEAGEEKNDPAFCAQLAALADVYVNDAFGTAHRAHASTAGVAKLFKERAAGPLMAREIAALSKVRDNPDRPFVAVVGGAKISGKLETLTSLAKRADTVVLVGWRTPFCSHRAWRSGNPWSRRSLSRWPRTSSRRRQAGAHPSCSRPTSSWPPGRTPRAGPCLCPGLVRTR